MSASTLSSLHASSSSHGLVFAADIVFVAGASTPRQIRKVAILGAGTMGSRIAAHIANAGLPVVLLDIVPPGTAEDAPKAERNRFALSAVDALKKAKPAAFYANDSARLITRGELRG